MIQVSNAFKENIKKKVRQIGGFAEVIVNGGYFQANDAQGSSVYISSNDKAEITNLNSVSDISSAIYKYASLEPNRTLLDGSFILANEDYRNENTGYISETTNGSGSFEIGSSSTSIIFTRTKGAKSVTLYFEEGYATDFTVEISVIYSGFYTQTYTYTVTNNDKQTVTIGGDDIPDIIVQNDMEQAYLCITGVTVNVTAWSTPNRRVRIRQINAGETLLFENRDLIEMNIDEQISLDNTDAPSNECNVLLNNYDRKFNLLDNDSVLNRLGKGSAIRPFIGVSTGGGIEYVDMCSYMYSSYTENQDKTITLYGAGTVESYSAMNNYLWTKGIPNGSVLTTLYNMGLENNDVTYNGTLPLQLTDTQNRREQLQAMAIYSGSYIKENRNFGYRLQSILSLKKVLPTSLSTIPLTSQIKEPKVTKRNKIKTIKLSSSQLGNLINEEKTLVDNYTDIPVNGKITIVINSSSPIDVTSLKVYIDNVEIQEGTSYFPGYTIYNSNFYPIVEITNLTDEQNGVIKIVGKEYNQARTETTITNENTANGETVEYNVNYLNNSYQRTRVAKYLFNNQRDYEFELNFNGDPSLETGDTITFETVDGDMIGVIESINTKFNGGLQATIKGVCNSVL